MVNTSIKLLRFIGVLRDHAAWHISATNEFSIDEYFISRNDDGRNECTTLQVEFIHHFFYSIPLSVVNVESQMNVYLTYSYQIVHSYFYTLCS